MEDDDEEEEEVATVEDEEEDEDGAASVDEEDTLLLPTCEITSEPLSVFSTWKAGSNVADAIAAIICSIFIYLLFVGVGYRVQKKSHVFPVWFFSF